VFYSAVLHELEKSSIYEVKTASLANPPRRNAQIRGRKKGEFVKLSYIASHSLKKEETKDELINGPSNLDLCKSLDLF
jgi:hypothetical protein